MHSVSIEFPLAKRTDSAAFLELEKRLAVTLRRAKAGRLDGNEIGPRSWKLFMVGTNATRLFDAIRPVLKASTCAAGASVTKQLGGPDAAEWTRILWRGRFRITRPAGRRARHPRVGDVFEFDCTGGVGRVQAAHVETKGAMKGLWVVRVFRRARRCDEHPVREEELCRAWLALGPCVAAGQMRLVATADLPHRRRALPRSIVNPAVIRSAVELDCSVDDDEVWNGSR